MCGHLEGIIRNYFLSQAGNPEAYWYAIYYDPTIDRYNECAEIIDKNLIGYVYWDNRVAFILNSCLERFIFELIDDGVKYLNPKHFSVKNLVKYCRLCIKEI